MSVNNQLVKKEPGKEKLGLSTYLTRDAVKDRINQVVGGKDGQRFISAVVSAVQTNPTLQECTNQSILSAALLGESLKLSPSPQLGHYYLVPFNDKDAGKVAQFQMGYKGYIQLAIRSGQYKKLNVMAIKEGELEYFDPLNEEIKVNLMVDDWDAREQAETIGYYAFFELVNGFRKAIYWSKKQMVNHADRYAPAFSAKGGTISTKYGDKKKVSYEEFLAGNYDSKDSWMYSSFWYKDFDGMAYKTMLRQLISKWGVMSVELQNAFESDMAFIHEDGTKTYVESDSEIIETNPAESEETIIEVESESPAEVAPKKAEKKAGKAVKEAEPIPVIYDDADAIQSALFG